LRVKRKRDYGSMKSSAIGAPDVVALTLDEAQKLLTASGFGVDVQKTYPTKRVSGNGRWRVIRQRRDENTFFLIAAEESLGVLP